MKPSYRLIRWLALLAIVAAAAAGAAETAERRFPLPDRGFLQLEVPADWQDQLRQPPERLPPTIAFRPRRGPAFDILITPIWPMRQEVAPSTAAQLRKMVEQTAEQMKPMAVEKRIEVVELRGTSGIGYYYVATDKAPKPGEYKYLTQGMLRVDNLLVTFTILTNDGQNDVVADALVMLQSAIHKRK